MVLACSSVDTILFFKKNSFFKDFIYLFMRDPERERERGRDTGKGKAGSMQGA